MNLENLDQDKELDRKVAAQEVLNTGDIEYKILEKIKF
jgi:hypothetical protein